MTRYCQGMQDENSNPICEGPDVRQYKVTLPAAIRADQRVFMADYCAICANDAAQYAVSVEVIQ